MVSELLPFKDPEECKSPPCMFIYLRKDIQERRIQAIVEELQAVKIAHLLVRLDVLIESIAV